MQPCNRNPYGGCPAYLRFAADLAPIVVRLLVAHESCTTHHLKDLESESRLVELKISLLGLTYILLVVWVTDDTFEICSWIGGSILAIVELGLAWHIRTFLCVTHSEAFCQPRSFGQAGCGNV